MDKDVRDVGLEKSAWFNDAPNEAIKWTHFRNYFKDRLPGVRDRQTTCNLWLAAYRLRDEIRVLGGLALDENFPDI